MRDQRVPAGRRGGACRARKFQLAARLDGDPLGGPLQSDDPAAVTRRHKAPPLQPHQDVLDPIRPPVTDRSTVRARAQLLLFDADAKLLRGLAPARK